MEGRYPPSLIMGIENDDEDWDITLVHLKGLSEANQILRLHENDAAAWAIDVRNEKERDGNHERKNQHQGAFRLSASSTVTKQQVAANGNHPHQTPGRQGDSIPPGGFDSTRRPACNLASLAHHSCPQAPGRPRASAVRPPGPGPRTIAHSATEPSWY